jgi:hypothetical protein
LKDKVVARMVELAGQPDSGWEVVLGTVGATIRWTGTETTPDLIRKRRPGQTWAIWEGDTYNTNVFITLVAGKFVMRASTAPWTPCQDLDLPLWLAEMVLEDPALGLDSYRQLELRRERKRG